MAEPESVIWGIHTGKTGDADRFFLNGKCVIEDWHTMGDLSTIKAAVKRLRAR